MADVFISYSKADRARVEALAHRLEECGYSVWWDAGLIAGHNFRDAIKRELELARAVVVLWTSSSVKSEWVISEAQRALVKAKLIPIRAPDLVVDEIPQPFDIRHTITEDKISDLRAAISTLLSASSSAQETSSNVDVPGKAAQRHPVAFVPRLIAAIAFSLFGISFVAFPTLLIYEFKHPLAFDLIAIDSRYMLFFPIIGMLVLASYFIPLSALLDMYWNYIRYGRMRLLLGGAIIASVSIFIGEALSGSRVRALWELSPVVLAQPIKCDSAPCAEPPTTIALTLRRLREIAQVRANLSEFRVSCRLDPLQDVPRENIRNKYCFAGTRIMSAPECCAAQRRFSEAVYRHWENDEGRSLIGKIYDSSIKTMMIMFVIIITSVGLFLVSWRQKLSFIFPTYNQIIRRHALAGSAAMMLFVLMDLGSDRSYSLLFGDFDSSSFRLSFALVPWFVLIITYLLGSVSMMPRLQLILLGIVLIDIAATNWDVLIGVAEKLFGAGMSGTITIGVLLVFVVVSIACIFRIETEQRQI